MLEIRLSCEHCEKSLPNDSSEAMICTYECTYCKDCVDHLLMNVCPNCGGGFEKRPTRPINQLSKHPPRQDKVFKPINTEEFTKILIKYQNVDPRKR